MGLIGSAEPTVPRKDGYHYQGCYFEEQSFMDRVFFSPTLSPSTTRCDIFRFQLICCLTHTSHKSHKLSQLIWAPPYSYLLNLLNLCNHWILFKVIKHIPTQVSSSTSCKFLHLIQTLLFYTPTPIIYNLSQLEKTLPAPASSDNLCELSKVILPLLE